MHDIDRTTLETGLNPYAEALFESEQSLEPPFPGETDPYESSFYEAPFQQGLFREPSLSQGSYPGIGEYETPYQEGDIYEDSYSETGPYGAPFQEIPYQEDTIREFPFSEAEEMELAAELLEINTEEELEQFLGKLFRKIGRGLRGVIKSPVFRTLGGMLKRVAKVALPVAGKVVGGAFGGPAGAMLGGQLASGAGRIFGLELEALSPEDREFEAARRFVRFAGSALTKGASAPPTVNPRRAAKIAIAQAAHRFAPGLVTPLAPGTPVRPGMAVMPPIGTARGGGRWIRRGNRIILLGV